MLRNMIRKICYGHLHDRRRFELVFLDCLQVVKKPVRIVSASTLRHILALLILHTNKGAMEKCRGKRCESRTLFAGLFLDQDFMLVYGGAGRVWPPPSLR